MWFLGENLFLSVRFCLEEFERYVGCVLFYEYMVLSDGMYPLGESSIFICFLLF